MSIIQLRLKLNTSQTRKRIKNITPKQIPLRLPIALAQVKADNTSENVLNEIRKIFILYIAEKKLLKSIQQCNEFIKVMKQNRHYSYEF